jgi:hypothetical protein
MSASDLPSSTIYRHPQYLAPELEALNRDFEHTYSAVMSQPVENRAGKPFCPQNLGPALKRQVRSHNDAVSFIGRNDDFKQQLRLNLGSRNLSRRIRNQEILPG